MNIYLQYLLFMNMFGKELFLHKKIPQYTYIIAQNYKNAYKYCKQYSRNTSWSNRSANNYS